MVVYKIYNSLLNQYCIKTSFMNITKKYSTQLLITEEIGDKAIITINRPNSLNALNAAVNKELYNTLKKFEKTKTMVIIKGAGNTAFSAGGDLMELELAIFQKNRKYLFDFNAYLNGFLYLLKTYKIPVVSFVNGFVFGAGTGISTFSKYTVVTEKAKFCMPEVRLGSVPNAGASYYFNRTQGQLGYYLALTGHAIKSSDILHAGFATHYAPSINLQQIEERLLHTTNLDDIKTILDHSCEINLPDFCLTPVLDKINIYFAAPTVEEIISNLKQDESEWAQKTVNVMKKCSPTSLKVVLRQLQKGKIMKLVHCLNMEDNLGKLFCYGPDGREGVRITLIEKDGIPQWDPPTLKEVTEQIIEKYFEKTIFDITDIQRGLFNARDM